MQRFKNFLHLTIVSTLLLSMPASTFARGGGGGGHSSGGGGGHISSGGRSVRSIGAGGYRGPAAGYRGYGGGYANRGFGYRGGGWGYPRSYGWGYPYYGYGLGLGLGLGLGYGLSSGYGYGGYGYPGYGYGYSPYNGTYVVAAPPVAPVVTASAVALDPIKATRSQEFSDRGTAAFRSADYETALYAYRHAVVDDPQNRVLTLQLALALFATGKYEEAAGATQAAMHMLPKEEWGTIVIRYQEFYGNRQDYTNHLRALEKAVNSAPTHRSGAANDLSIQSDAARRFLVGYHYGYLGFLKPSIKQLEIVIQLEPRDEMARKLKDEMRSRLENFDVPAPIPAP